MKRIFFFLAAFFLPVLIPAESPGQQREPKIGYVYPAGGQRGTTFQVLVSGRQIARSKEVVISGRGVQGRVVRGIPTMRVTDSDERRVIQQLYQEARGKLEGNAKSASAAGQKDVKKRESPARKEGFRANGNQELSVGGTMPEKRLTPAEIVKKYPYLERLAEPTARDVELVYDFYFAPRSERKPVEALGQGVMLEITIAPDAEPGDRDLRLMGPNGLTMPVRFLVGNVPEVMEREPNDPQSHSRGHIEIWNRTVKDAPSSLLKRQVYDLPVVFNGQIRAGDIDRFPFTGRRGQKLVIDVRARHLTPYLADGVPGWFQACVSLFDQDGRKIAEAMSYRHEPDPVLQVDIPKNGVYFLEIQDSIFRGRDDFVYRITVGELPMVTSMFPLGVRRGTASGADIDGWNLPKKAVLLDGENKTPGIYETASVEGNAFLRPVRFGVDDLPEHNEKEPNNTVREAKKISLPLIVNGRISDENDVDCFAFDGRKGDRIVVDVAARSLDSPLDALVELIDPQGKMIVMNDDRADSKGPNIGLETHHADPYLNVEIPTDGRYVVRLYDVTRGGGKEYGYRLRISKPKPDFAVFCEPSSLTLRGQSQPLKIHLVRKDGFSGEVKLRIPPGIPVRIEKGNIAAEAHEGTVELSASANFKWGLKEVPIEATAVIDGKEIVRPLIAVEDMEQAFIYHHWVPAKSLMVYQSGERSRNRNRPIPTQK